jgi:glycosyltransferase involved in cell wall biosynthesis
MKISLALATYNEESNIGDCIESCKGLVDEIVVVDGSSTDRTGILALQAGARVIRTDNPPMFHINKQKAIEACSGEWILQLDADERVTPELAQEIQQILQMTNDQMNQYQKNLKERKLFERHQSIVQQNWKKTSGNYNAFFIPRLNYFLGGYLRSGGVYPDGVIRLIRRGKAYLPCKDVHELMEVDGKSGWLANPLIHKDSPTFKRYLERNSRYIDHLVANLNSRDKKFQISNFKFQIEMIDWVIIKPICTFFSLLIRHKGIMDGWRGVVFAFFSAIRFARAYRRYTMIQ